MSAWLARARGADGEAGQVMLLSLCFALVCLLLVTVGQTTLTPAGDPVVAAPVLTLFVITIAAAEVVIALAVMLALYRARGHLDLHADLGAGPGEEEPS